MRPIFSQVSSLPNIKQGAKKLWGKPRMGRLIANKLGTCLTPTYFLKNVFFIEAFVIFLTH